MEVSEILVAGAVGAFVGGLIGYLFARPSRTGAGYIPTVGGPTLNPKSGGGGPQPNDSLTWTVHGSCDGDDRLMFACYAESGDVAVQAPDPQDVHASPKTDDLPVTFTVKTINAGGYLHAQAISKKSGHSSGVTDVAIVTP